MNEITIERTCTRCDGSGSITFPPPGDNGDCPQCGGAGKFEWNIDATDLFDKLDGIIIEQTSQREDLTSALTAIWNKVKDL